MTQLGDPQPPTLWETESLRVEPGADADDPPRLIVGNRRLKVPDWRRWFGGLRCWIDDQWQPARFLALPPQEGTQTGNWDGLVEGPYPDPRVRIEVGFGEFMPEELAFWQFEIDPESPVLAHEERDIAIPRLGLDGELPRLPAGWRADRLIERRPWGLRWQAAHMVEGASRVFDHLRLPWDIVEQILPGLIFRRDRGDRELGGGCELWIVRDGLLLSRPPTRTSLRQAQRSGELDWLNLLEACFCVAQGLDLLADFGHSARRLVSMDSIGVHFCREDGVSGWIDEGGYPDDLDLARAGLAAEPVRETHPPERWRCDPPGPAGDQYGLALAYIQARTDLVPQAGVPPVELLRASGRNALLGVEREVLARALAEAPAERWPTSRAFIATLAAALGMDAPWVHAFAEPEKPPPAHAPNVIDLAKYRLALPDYRGMLLLDFPPPTSAQIEAFVEYVASKHSWYKHLPLTPPGRAFIVYLDPGAGMRMVENPQGESRLVPIGRDESHFHHSMMPTEVYRERFGLLRVADQGAPSFRLHGPGRVEFAEGLPGVLAQGRIQAVPPQVAFAGYAEVTALVHERCRELWIWRRRLFETLDGDPLPDGSELYWPHASGGPAILQAIRCLARDARRDDEESFHFGRDRIDYQAPLELLVAPERERQRQLLRSAIGRVLDLVYG
jgi:hypothetical protein